MFKILIYNSRGNPNDNRLLGGIEDVDIMLLPYCHVGMGMAIRRQLGFHIVWKPTTDISDNIGICVMSKEQLNVDTRSVDIKIDHTDPMSSNKYQLFNVNGFKLCHAMPQNNELIERVYQYDIETKGPDLILGQSVARINSDKLAVDSWRMDQGIMYITFKEVK